MKRLLGLATIVMIAPLAFVTNTNTKDVKEELKISTYAPECNAGMSGTDAKCGFAGGMGTESDPWTIGTYNQLLAINNLVDAPSSRVFFEITDNIRADKKHTPIKTTSKFTMKSKGNQGKQIYIEHGIETVVDGTNNAYNGLFKTIDDAYISDIKLDVAYDVEEVIAQSATAYYRGTLAGSATKASVNHSSFVWTNSDVAADGTQQENLDIYYGGVFGKSTFDNESTFIDLNITGDFKYTGGGTVKSLNVGGLSAAHEFAADGGQVTRGITYIGNINTTTLMPIVKTTVGGLFGKLKTHNMGGDKVLVERAQSAGKFKITDSSLTTDITVAGLIGEIEQNAGSGKYGIVQEVLTSTHIEVVARNASSQKVKMAGVTGEILNVNHKQAIADGTLGYADVKEDGSTELFVSSVAISASERLANLIAKDRMFTEQQVGYIKSASAQYTLENTVAQGKTETENYNLHFWRNTFGLTEGFEEGKWLLYGLIDHVYPMVSHRYVFDERPTPINPDPTSESSNILLYVGIATGALLVGGSGYIVHKRKTRKFM